MKKNNAFEEADLIDDQDFSESFTDYCYQTPKEGNMLGNKKGKGHHKYYSAIQSPTLRRSPERI